MNRVIVSEHHAPLNLGAVGIYDLQPVFIEGFQVGTTDVSYITTKGKSSLGTVVRSDDGLKWNPASELQSDEPE